MNDLLTAALDWAQKGVPVFPCTKTKSPIAGTNGHLDASTDAVIVKDMFMKHGRKVAMIGAAMGETSGLFCIDFDIYKMPVNLYESMKAQNLLPATRTHSTTSGGVHLFYWMPEGEVIRAGKMDKHIDIKGEGGYVILPPSPGYQVIDNSPVAEAPLELIDRIKSRQTNVSKMSVSDLEQEVLSGENFHEALAMIAAKRHGRGEDPKTINRELLELLNASVARSPEHERHSRWRTLMADGGKELSRISRSAANKYNAKNTADDDYDVFMHVSDPLAGISVPDSSVALPTDVDIDEFPVPAYKYAADLASDDERDYLLYPLIYEGDTIVLSAAPKVGKTMLSTTIALHIAAGMNIGSSLMPMRGHDAGKRPVIYFALEGQSAIRKRIDAWIRHHKENGMPDVDEDLRLFINESPLNLGDEKQKQNMINEIVLLNLWFDKQGWGGTGLIVVDTLTKAMPGKDQNSVDDTSAVFEVLGKLKQAGVNSAVMFVHHDSKDGKAPRGSSNILAEPDTVLSVNRGKDVVIGKSIRKKLELSVYMARTIDDTQEYEFSILDYYLGVNRQGFKQTAPILEAIQTAVQDPDEMILAEIADGAKIAVDIIKTTLMMYPDSTLEQLHTEMLNTPGPLARQWYMTVVDGREDLFEIWEDVSKIFSKFGVSLDVNDKNGNITLARVGSA